MTFIVIDKPSGIAVHSGTRHQVGLIEAMRIERIDLPNVELAHRLDKDTSGLLVLAKNKRVLRHLHAQWRREDCNTSLKKRYQALLVGYWAGKTRNIESHTQNSQKPSRTKQVKTVALSRFSPIQNFSSYTLVDIELHTGKMPSSANSCSTDRVSLSQGTVSLVIKSPTRNCGIMVYGECFCMLAKSPYLIQQLTKF